MSASGSSETGAERLAPGASLRAARTAQKLAIGDVARQLRLSVAQVEALETGAFERLPGPVFVRGFIRNYARLLKLDPEPLIQSAAPLPASEPVGSIDMRPRGEPLPGARRIRWGRYAIGALCVVSGLAAYEYFASLPGPVVTPSASEAVSAAVPAAPTNLQTSPPAGSVPANADSAGAEPAAPNSKPDGGAAPDAAPTVASRVEGGAPPVSGSAEILLTFEGDSWVEVRDQGGTVIHSQVNRRGTEQRVSGVPPLLVVIGNAQAVRLTYNDRRVDLDPYTRHAVARLTLE